jgi:hypothetical protein
MATGKRDSGFEKLEKGTSAPGSSYKQTIFEGANTDTAADTKIKIAGQE